jgi:hypothetical protein
LTAAINCQVRLIGTGLKHLIERIQFDQHDPPPPSNPKKSPFGNQGTHKREMFMFFPPVIPEKSNCCARFSKIIVIIRDGIIHLI